MKISFLSEIFRIAVVGRKNSKYTGEAMDISSEDLAYWYLRLNGFLTLRNFIVHPDKGSDQETDVDLIGVRFPFRAENLKRPMQDDSLFSNVKLPYIVFAEVKAGQCGLNGPWTKPERGNMKRVLHAMGAFPETTTQDVATYLYEDGFFENSDYRISIVCFGSQKNQTITNDRPMVPQILWPECLKFMFNRFRTYKTEKASHGQWDQVGRDLWNQCDNFRRDLDGFLKSIKVF